MLNINNVITRMLLDEMPCPVYLKDGGGIFIYANPAFFELIEMPKSRIIGKRVEDFANTQTALKSKTTDMALRKDAKNNDYVMTHLRKNKSELIIQAKKRLVTIPEYGQCIMCVMNDISQFVQYEKELEEKHRELRSQQGKLKELASLDPLTGIYNRRAFYDQAKEIIDYAKVGDLDVGVLMFDLDKFKDLNDTYGHAIGDEVLLRFTKVVSDCCRTSDIFARLGGEEFCLLLPDTPEGAARNIAERVRQRIEKATVMVNGDPIHFTTSVGGTMWVAHETKIDSTLNRADNYLYEAKNSGRNVVQFILEHEDKIKDNSSAA
ncbi:MAG: diguanylate cyclase [Hyphomicrobiales bacterium]